MFDCRCSVCMSIYIFVCMMSFFYNGWYFVCGELYLSILLVVKKYLYKGDDKIVWWYWVCWDGRIEF